MRANAAEMGIQSFIRIYFVKMLQLMYDPVIRGVLLLFQVIKGMAYKMPSFNLLKTMCFFIFLDAWSFVPTVAGGG